jgi:hypothetical protein
VIVHKIIAIVFILFTLAAVGYAQIPMRWVAASTIT